MTVRAPRPVVSPRWNRLPPRQLLSMRAYAEGCTACGALYGIRVRCTATRRPTCGMCGLRVRRSLGLQSTCAVQCTGYMCGPVYGLRLLCGLRVRFTGDVCVAVYALHVLSGAGCVCSAVDGLRVRCGIWFTVAVAQ